MVQQLSIGDLCTSDTVALVHARRQKKADKEKPEDIFDAQLRSHRLPAYARQAQFAKQSMGRLWKFDFCWHPYMLAVEIEGLVVMRMQGQLVVRGRHASIQGMKEDMDKYNAAALLGWSVLRFEQTMVKNRTALETTMRYLAMRGWKREPAALGDSFGAS